MTCMMCRQVQCTRSVLQRAVSKEYAVFRYSMTRDVQETKGDSNSMEHWERIEGGDARESGEGAEEERGAGSDEREAVAGSKRERGGLTGGIKKISRRRGHQGRGRRAHCLVNNGEMQKDRAIGTRGMRVRHCPSGSVSQG